MPESSKHQVFAGVRFLLLGFDIIKQHQVRTKLLEGGATDAVIYGSDSTHIIVDNLVYDEPICVAARRDGKTLVTRLWVDHSFDVGMPVDPTSIMYRPMRDLDGIPGAKSMVVCLTGYQRQDREDIMTMVALMGANFSKPLVANKVTHLICYKFEGEKYELANKMKKIKLVNHHWLEDCLKAWEILPEADYRKSGYELEMEMEAEAKDSEEETEDIAAILVVGREENKCSHQSPDVARKSLNLSGSKSLSNTGDVSNIETSPFKNTDFRKLSFSRETHVEKAEDSAKMSPIADPSKLSGNNNLRSTPGKSSLPLSSERIENNVSSPAASNVNKFLFSGGSSDFARVNKDTPLGPKEDLNISAVSEDRQEINEKAPQRSRLGLKKSPISDLSVKELSSSRTVNSTGGVEVHRSDVQISDMFREEKMDGRDDLKLTNVGNSSSRLAPLITKMLGKKTLGSRPIQNKGSLNLQKVVLRNEDINYSVGGTNSDKSQDIRKNKTSYEGSPVDETKVAEDKGLNEVEPGNDKEKNAEVEAPDSVNISRDKRVRAKKVKMAKSVENEEGNEAQSGFDNTELAESKSAEKKITKGKKRKSKSMTNKSKDPREDYVGIPVDENKAAEDKRLNGVEPGNDKEKYAEVEVQDSGNISRDKRARAKKQKLAKSVENEKGYEEQNGIDKTELFESKSAAGEKNLTTGDKCKSKSITKKSKDPSEDAEKDGSKRKQEENKNKRVSGNKETVVIACQTKTRPSKKLKSSTGTEKGKEHKSVNNKDTGEVEKFSPQPSKKPLKNGLKAEKARSESLVGARNFELKTETARFIVSGHRLQRKEFHKLIKTLEGRVCRDSHNWSYQATHFIVPDPIRRTEKFFAAAASGSWILKTDYLTASNEAGKLLPEGPYEWHKKCLTEDGAINLEAPRKWRLLRERTGHGAFYGMRIVTYGECIAPPLDTLKRVMKAGDGTILATSPPYTRFLQSGIDFAVISPGMPRVDMWVQEFLRHEIPCVVADYLVEYVCKPGYSLDKHVQYNTHAWAKKSLENHMNRVEEVVMDVGTLEFDDSVDDVPCQVCGCRDRGDEMLICGDEMGVRGCGIGIHLDCLDPPLEEVPAEDWFCPKCSKKKTKRSNSKSGHKSASKSKR